MKNPQHASLALEAIASSLREREHAPTFRELALELGWPPTTGLSRVDAVLKMLERSGRLIRHGSRSREMAIPAGAYDNRPSDLYELDRRLNALPPTTASYTVEVPLLRQWMAHTMFMERMMEQQSSAASANAPARNRWSGKCHACNGSIARGEGVVVQVEGKWRTFHHEHSGLTEAQREALPEVGPQSRTAEERARR